MRQVSERYVVALVADYPVTLTRQIYIKTQFKHSYTGWPNLLSTESSRVGWHEGEKDTSVSILTKA